MQFTVIGHACLYIEYKNIKLLNGKPLLGHVISKLKKSKKFSRIIVSTDCKNIASIARRFGAEVPFLREKKLADEYTPTYKVLIDCIKKIKSMNEEYHFCVYPTSIFINNQDIKKGFLKIKKMKYDCLVTLKKYTPSPQRSFQINNQKIFFSYPKYSLTRSQELKNFFYDTGTFYIFRTKSLLKLNSNNNLPNKTTYIIMKNDVVDINDKNDLKKAKQLIKSSNNKLFF